MCKCVGLIVVWTAPDEKVCFEQVPRESRASSTRGASELARHNRARRKKLREKEKTKCSADSLIVHVYVVVAVIIVVATASAAYVFQNVFSLTVKSKEFSSFPCLRCFPILSFQEE